MSFRLAIRAALTATLGLVLAPATAAPVNVVGGFDVAAHVAHLPPAAIRKVK